MCVFFFFKQKTAYEMRISDWSSDVCSSDLFSRSMRTALMSPVSTAASISVAEGMDCAAVAAACCWQPEAAINKTQTSNRIVDMVVPCPSGAMVRISRSEEHTSELQSLMRISYAVFCLKKKKQSHDDLNSTTREIQTQETKIK